MLIKGIIKNPFAKFIMRKRPSNRFFNFLLKVYISKKRLESDLGKKGNYFFSDKSALSLGSCLKELCSETKSLGFTVPKATREIILSISLI